MATPSPQLFDIGGKVNPQPSLVCTLLSPLCVCSPRPLCGEMYSSTGTLVYYLRRFGMQPGSSSLPRSGRLNNAIFRGA